MGRHSTGWLERLEEKYQEDRMTLMPRLLDRNGMVWLAKEAGVSLGLVSRWCSENGFEKRVTWHWVEKTKGVIS